MRLRIRGDCGLMGRKIFGPARGLWVRIPPPAPRISAAGVHLAFAELFSGGATLFSVPRAMGDPLDLLRGGEIERIVIHSAGA